jgi:hypothetical protein
MRKIGFVLQKKTGFDKEYEAVEWTKPNLRLGCYTTGAMGA